MNKYNRGKIYKIVDNTNGNVYIGSTCEPTLARRLTKHRGHYKEYLKGGNYTTSFKILENNNYSIVLLEEFPCETKDQLLARERYYIDNNDCVNKYIPTRTNKEYREQNKDKIKQKMKEYYEQNKDKLNKKAKEYYEQNKDKIIDNQKDYNKIYQKEYYEQNKDKIINYKKEYRDKNKDKIKQKMKEYYEQNKGKMFTCECGSFVCFTHKSKHLKSIKHQNYLNNKNKITSNDILNA
jgi:hypothetical protein